MRRLRASLCRKFWPNRSCARLVAVFSVLVLNPRGGVDLVKGGEAGEGVKEGEEGMVEVEVDEVLDLIEDREGTSTDW